MRTTKAPINTFVVRCLDSITPILDKSKISRLYLVFVAEQAGLSLTLSHSSEDMFSHDVAHNVVSQLHSSTLIYAESLGIGDR